MRHKIDEKQAESLNVIHLLLGVAKGCVADTQEALELGDLQRADLETKSLAALAGFLSARIAIKLKSSG